MHRIALATMLTLVSCSSSSAVPDGGALPDGGWSPEGAPSLCPAPAGAGTTHPGAWLTADETWTAADSPHFADGTITVQKDVTLTIDPCVEVRMKGGASLIVDGKLVARGEAQRPIDFRPGNPAERFAALWVRAPGTADLAYATVQGGGAPGSTDGATVMAEGSGFPPVPALRVEHVRVLDSAGYGVYMWKWAAFTEGSTDLTVQGAGRVDSAHPFPVRMSVNAVGTLPAGQYTGNAGDAIQVVAESPHYQLEIDDTFRNRGVPYQIGGNGMFGVITVVGASGLATMTVEPGVTLKFDSSSSNVGGLFIGNTGVPGTGRLIAVGTASAPILFTGVESTAGYWEGITFQGAIAGDNRLEHVRIEAGGAHGGDSGFGCPPPGNSFATDAALKLFTEPPAGFLASSTIARSSAHGVFSAWKGSPIDFTAGNTFQEIAGCNEVDPKAPDGSCPSDPPCPK